MRPAATSKDGLLLAVSQWKREAARENSEKYFFPFRDMGRLESGDASFVIGARSTATRFERLSRGDDRAQRNMPRCVRVFIPSIPMTAWHESNGPGDGRYAMPGCLLSRMGFDPLQTLLNQ
jgi:hypothetical protein